MTNFRRVHPGDTILVHAGLMSATFHYMNGTPSHYNAGSVTDGTVAWTRAARPMPIVIKGAGDGEAIFDGAGAENLFNLLHANYNYFEGITVRNTTVAFLLGWDIAGSSGFFRKRSRIYDVARAVRRNGRRRAISISPTM